MVFVELCAKLRVVFVSFIAIFRRALCCFSRRRRPSGSDTDETLQCVNVDVGYPKRRNENERDWNSWDDSPRTVEEHIEQYRSKLGRPNTPKEAEPEPDFFSDMTPRIKPQPKYFLGDDNEQKTDFSRLAAKSDVPIATTADLEDWTEEDAGGWEELDTESTKQLIREKRKEIRNQRHTAGKQKSPNGGITSQQAFAEKIIHPRHS